MDAVGDAPQVRADLVGDSRRQAPDLLQLLREEALLLHPPLLRERARPIVMGVFVSAGGHAADRWGCVLPCLTAAASCAAQGEHGSTQLEGIERRGDGLCGLRVQDGGDDA